MRLRSVLITLPLLTALSSSAQTPEKIIDQSLKSQGGAKSLSKVHTLSLEGTFTTSGNKSGTYTLKTKLPNRYYSEILSGDKTSIEAYNGKSAWTQTPAGEINTLVGTDGAQLEAAGQYYNSHLIDAKKNKLGLSFLGHAQVAGKDTLEIEVTTPAGLKRQVFYDAQTHLIVRESATVGGIDQQILYSDYRSVNGIKLPYKIELHRGNESFDISVTRASINSTVGERVFDFPKKSQVQLPDLTALFKDVQANQKAIGKIRENYAGTRNEEETDYDKTGKVTKTERKEFSFFYLDGQQVSTLVKKDGQPLNENEQQKENDKTQKEIQGIQKKDAKKEKAKEEGKDKEDDDDVTIETFLHTAQFVNPRRERFRGQDVLVFDFEPNPEFKAHKLGEKLAQKLAGVIWVDEKAHQVVRLEAYFVGDMKIGGGVLANLQKGTSFVFEQAYVNNELWLPTYAEVHLGVRVLLVKGFKVNQVIRYSDYKKFNVESVSTIGKPKDASGATPATPPPAPNPPKPQ
ncbi:MAG TPA: hypothetical protein VGI16_11160 [Candidatus Acidoferrum sp.]|jgi:hypothetical protein